MKMRMFSGQAARLGSSMRELSREELSDVAGGRHHGGRPDKKQINPG